MGEFWNTINWDYLVCGRLFLPVKGEDCRSSEGTLVLSFKKWHFHFLKLSKILPQKIFREEGTTIGLFYQYSSINYSLNYFSVFSLEFAAEKQEQN